jgi:hypothetical protein
MVLRTFLEFLEKQRSLPDCRVMCFSGKEYSFLFFSYIFSFLQKNHKIVERINCLAGDVGTARALLSTMGFQGNNIYWLEGFHSLTNKKQLEWIAYLQTYSGPHQVLFFST